MTSTDTPLTGAERTSEYSLLTFETNLEKGWIVVEKYQYNCSIIASRMDERRISRPIFQTVERMSVQFLSARRH